MVDGSVELSVEEGDRRKRRLDLVKTLRCNIPAFYHLVLRASQETMGDRHPRFVSVSRLHISLLAIQLPFRHARLPPCSSERDRLWLLTGSRRPNLTRTRRCSRPGGRASWAVFDEYLDQVAVRCRTILGEKTGGRIRVAVSACFETLRRHVHEGE